MGLCLPLTVRLTLGLEPAKEMLDIKIYSEGSAGADDRSERWHHRPS
jgi:hypothetical protein